MDKLQKCAKAFENLLEIQYRIIIGRKGKTVELVIGFSKLDFHHLMGLGKLKDLRIAKQNRGSVFDEIITGITTYETLTKSRYLAQIENRFEPLALVEQLLDDNRLVFRYNTKLNQFSCYNIFASEEWQPATSRGISLLKLLEWEGNGLTLFSKGFVPVIKSVSHLPIRSVRFVQVEPRVRVTKQIESAMGKDGSVHCKFFQE